jgi:RNA polymerase sigma-70 factor (ECF subfamily)
LSELEPEIELVHRALAGEEAAFAALCTRSQARLWRTVASVAYGPDVDDLAQEAIVRAYCALRTYRFEAPFAAWLCRIALNVAHDYQRSGWRRRVRFWQETPDAQVEQTEHPEHLLAQREMQRRVRQAVAALPVRQRVPIWLHYFEEFTLAEIARLECTAESTARSRLQAGLRRLSFSLEDLRAGSLEARERTPSEVKGCQI